MYLRARSFVGSVSAHRWLVAWILAGLLLAAGLLVNSVLNYTFVSRKLAFEQLRREMREEVVAVERLIRSAGSDPQAIPAAVANVYAESGQYAFIQVRTREGKLRAKAGMASGSFFSNEQIQTGLQKRQPVARESQLGGREVVVEIFPLRIAAQGIARPAPVHLEMAIWRDSSSATYWPLRRNLILNCSAALALMLTLVMVAIRCRSYTRGQKLQRELEIARRVQQDLLPAMQPGNGRIQLAAECIPVSEVGGDFYDAYAIDEHRQALILGDVSGKGMPAALLMGVLHGAIRSVDWYSSSGSHCDASARLNRLLCDQASQERFATLFWAWYDTATEQLRYVTAGHCPPLLVRNHDGYRHVESLDVGGPVLGLLPRATYSQGQAHIRPGDLLLLFSDGLIEAAAPNGEQFGADRLEEILLKTCAEDADGVMQDVLAAVRTFTNGVEFGDDLTLVAVRFGSDADAGCGAASRAGAASLAALVLYHT